MKFLDKLFWLTMAIYFSLLLVYMVTRPALVFIFPLIAGFLVTNALLTKWKDLEAKP